MKIKQLLSTTAMLLALSLSGQSYATEADDAELLELMSLGLEELTVSVASKRQESIHDAPGVINVITAEEIAGYGGRNLLDVLERLPGVWTGGGGIGQDSMVVFRGQAKGFTNTHTLMLINGRPFRDGYLGGGEATILRGFPLSIVERIEVIRGPGSVLYGSNAFAGVLNIITKEASSKIEQSLTGTYGSFNTQEMEYSISTIQGDVGISGGAKLYDVDGWDSTAANLEGITNTSKRRNYGHTVFTNMKYKDLTLNYISAHTYNPTSGLDTGHLEFRDVKRHHFLDVGYELEINDDWTSNFNITYNGSYQKLSQALRKFNHFSNDFLTELSINGNLSDKVNVLAGGVYERRTGKTRQSNDKYDFTTTSTYLQMDYKPFDWLKLIAGGQINDPEGLDYDLSPRYAAIANITDKWGIKLLYSDAFRQAYPFEIFSGVGGPRPPLRPENISTFDAQIFYHTPKYSASFTYFHSDQTDSIILQRIDDVIGFFNVGDIYFEGFELEGKININRNWMIEGSISHQDNKTDQDVSDSTLLPNFMAKIGSTHKFNNGITFGLFGSHYGEPGNKPAVSPFVSAVNPKEESYTIITTNLTVDVNKILNLQSIPKTTFALYGENLLDENFYFPELASAARINTIPIRSGRAIYAKLTMRF